MVSARHRPRLRWTCATRRRPFCRPMDKPTICAVNGGAAGYGMDTALGCDIRIMAESAKLAAAFVKRGVVPESGRYMDFAAHDRLGQGIGVDFHRPHALGAANFSNGVLPTKSCRMPR